MWVSLHIRSHVSTILYLCECIVYVTETLSVRVLPTVFYALL